jgi:hypothetical protein
MHRNSLGSLLAVGVLGFVSLAAATISVAQRVVLSTGLKPGDKFQIAVFGINGPISMAPANSVFVREAKLELFK